MQKKYEFAVLGMVGLIQVTATIQALPWNPSSEQCLKVMNRFLKVDLQVVLDDLADLIPVETAEAEISFKHEEADKVVALLARLIAGQEVLQTAIDELPEVFATESFEAQVAKRALEADVEAAAGGKKPRVTKKTPAKGFEIKQQLLEHYATHVHTMTKKLMTSKTCELNLCSLAKLLPQELRDVVLETGLNEAEKVVLIAFKWIQAMGLGQLGPQKSSEKLMHPPDAYTNAVTQKLTGLLKIDEKM